MGAVGGCVTMVWEPKDRVWGLNQDVWDPSSHDLPLILTSEANYVNRSKLVRQSAMGNILTL